MKFPAAAGRVFPGFLAGTGRLAMGAAISVSPHYVRPPFYSRLIWRRVADDDLKPSGKAHPPWADTPWADTIVPLVKSAVLKEATP